MKGIKKLLRRLTSSISRAGANRISKKAAAVSESEICLMYALDDGKLHSQRQIADEWKVPRTTLNTIVKRWEKDGLLEMRKIAGKRREKEICLTNKGVEKVKNTLAENYDAENSALELTIEKYSDSFIDALEFYADTLKEQQEKLKRKKRNKK